MITIIFLCIMKAIYLQCLCEISRQLTCPLLRYCFFYKKGGRKLLSPTLPINACVMLTYALPILTSALTVYVILH